MTFDEANNYIKKRINEPTRLNSAQLSANLDKRMRAQAFFSAKVADSRVLERMRKMSDAYSRGETDLATLRSDFKQWLQREAPEAAQGKGIENIGSTARLNLVLRQNAAMAASVGRYQVSRSADVEERWPCWRYIAGHNPRPSHAALDGKVFLKSDPIWHKIYPPWDFNCNCDVEDAELPAGGADHARAEDIQGTESGFEFDPADAFTEFDTEAITSEFDRANTIAAMQDQFGAEPAEDTPGVLVMPDAPPTPVEEDDATHAAKRKMQWQAAYDKRRDEWKKRCEQAIPVQPNHPEYGDYKRIVNDLVNQYTPEMAKLGKPPVLEFGPRTSFYNNDTNTLRIDGEGKRGDERKWLRLTGCVKHEFGHWFHHRCLERAPELRQETLDAAADDWRRLRNIFRRNGEADSLRHDECSYYFAQKIYGKGYFDLDLEEKHAVGGVTDTIGSIANDWHYGYGHDPYTGQYGRNMRAQYGTKDYYKIQNIGEAPHSEAFANIHALRTELPDPAFIRELFPETYNVYLKMKGVGL